MALFQGELTLASQYLSHSLSIYREIGDRRAATDALNNLGYATFLRKDYVEARERFEECLLLFQSVGFQWGQVNTLTNLGHVSTELGDAPQATRYFHEALEQAIALKAIPLILEIIAGMSRLLAYAGQEVLALEWLGLVLDHPASSSDIKAMAEPLLAELQSAVADDEFEVALNRGRQRDLDSLTTELFETKFESPIDFAKPDVSEEVNLLAFLDLLSTRREEQPTNW